MSGIAVTVSSSRLREIAGQMKEDFPGNIYQFLELAANTIDMLSGVPVPGIPEDQRAVGYAVRTENGAVSLTRGSVGAFGAVALFKSPVPYAYLVEGSLQWTKAEVGAGTPVFARVLPPDTAAGHPLGDSEEAIKAERYDYVRTLTAQQFAEIFKENIQTGKHFDQIVDDRRTKTQI